MWKPKSPYWPIDHKGVITLDHVISRNEFGEIDQFAGTLRGEPYRSITSRNLHGAPPEQEHFVLAWRKPETSTFAVYLWGAGQQERVGTVQAKFVHRLDNLNEDVVD